MGHSPSMKVLQQKSGGSPPRLRQRVRCKAAARSTYSIDLLVRLLVMFLARVAAKDTDKGVDCCTGEYASVDCSSGVEHLGKVWQRNDKILTSTVSLDTESFDFPSHLHRGTQPCFLKSSKSKPTLQRWRVFCHWSELQVIVTEH